MWYRMAKENDWRVKWLRRIRGPLSGLAAIARQCSSFEEFKHDFLIQIKHGMFWHVTENENFEIDPQKGPRDMSSLAGGEIDPGKLMITTDLPYWASNYKDEGRGYAAEIDMSDVPRDQYGQVNRGFGNEFWVNDPSQARVRRTLPLDKALRAHRSNHKLLPQSEGELRQFYEVAKSL